MDDGKGPDIWGAIVSGAMGAAGMLVRLVFHDKSSMTLNRKILHMAAAGVLAIIVGYSINDIITSDSAKMAILGMMGCAAPEIVDMIIKRAVQIFKKLSR